MATEEDVLPHPPFWFTSAMTWVLGNLITEPYTSIEADPTIPKIRAQGVCLCRGTTENALRLRSKHRSTKRGQILTSVTCSDQRARTAKISFLLGSEEREIYKADRSTSPGSTFDASVVS